MQQRKFSLVQKMSLIISLCRDMPPLSAVTDNNADVCLCENDPKYGDDSREAITSRFYQTATVSDVRMADNDKRGRFCFFQK